MKKKLISGIIVTMFLVTMVTFALPMRVSAAFDGDYQIGVIGPKGWVQWDGMKEGAELAQAIINNPGSFGLSGWGPLSQGGLYDPDANKYYEVKLVEIDEHAVPVPDPTAAVTELLTALEDNPDMDILVGGFRSECCFPMREAAMDYAAVHGRPIWIIMGAATNELIDDGPETDNPFDDVREDYERYKYMFRANPLNMTNLFFQLAAGLLTQLIIPKLSQIFPENTVANPYYPSVGPERLIKAYIIAEDLIWCESGVEDLQEYAPLLGYSVVGVGRPSAIETDFAPFLDEVEDKGAKLIIPIFSAVAGATFIKQWGERKVTAMPVGINVESQMQEFYASIAGKCEYETLLASVGTRTNLVPGVYPLDAAEFWDAYEARYGHSPIYTAWGVYNYIMNLNQTTTMAGPPDRRWMGKTTDEIIDIMEIKEPLTGLMGAFKFTTYHDVWVEETAMTPMWPSVGDVPSVPGKAGTVRAMIPQWQAGNLEVVWPRGYWIDESGSGPFPDSTPLPFARKWKIPSWIYTLAETDFAGGPGLKSPPQHLAEMFGRPAGFFAVFTSPDGTVGPADMAAVTGLWQDTCSWNVLEADMDGNLFIDIDDVARVALDWGKTA